MGWLDEIGGKSRFAFGRNWKNFSRIIDEQRIDLATRCLADFAGLNDLTGLTFVDVGCGSGLMSLAAYRMGASVFSFDYDKDSVECTKALRSRYCENVERWDVVEGSVLDREFLRTIGQYDVVYSWGVLHHTGQMWNAIENLELLVKENAVVYIALYNFQEHWSSFYLALKKAYTRANFPGKFSILFLYLLYTMGIAMMFDILRLRNPVKRYQEKKKQRGMSYFYDAIDWVGGYPFEVARPEEIILRYVRNGYVIVNLKTVGGGLACNEYCFRKKMGKN